MDGEETQEQENKTPTPATKADLLRWRNKRRIVPFDWPHVNRVHLQSARAAEFIVIDCARTRANMAAMSGRVKDHEAATREFMLLVCYKLVLDTENQPFFTEDDRQFILDLDPVVTDPLIDAAMRHCSIASIDVEAAQKVAADEWLQFAYWLWFALKRWDTVDDMLEALTPEQLAYARIMREVVPLDDMWRIGGTIAASAHNDSEREAAGRAGIRHIDASRWRTAEDFIPRVRVVSKAALEVDHASIDAHQAAIESRQRGR